MTPSKIAIGAGLLISVLAAAGAQAAGAKADVVLSSVQTYASCGDGATLIRNTNEASRVVATVSIAYPLPFPTTDRFFLSRGSPNAPTAGVLLLPGETRFLHCGSWSWQVLGAYYPLADMTQPPDPNPADSLLLVFDTKVATCAAGEQVLRAQNIHPLFGLVFKYTPAGGKEQILALEPLNSMPITSCLKTRPNITFDAFQFLK